MGATKLACLAQLWQYARQRGPTPSGLTLMKTARRSRWWLPLLTLDTKSSIRAGWRRQPDGLSLRFLKIGDHNPWQRSLATRSHRSWTWVAVLYYSSNRERSVSWSYPNLSCLISARLMNFI